MPRHVRFSILAAGLLLAGCWMGDGLYSSSDARQPIPAGIYRAIARDEKPHLERVTLLPSGMTTIGDEDGNSVYGFAPLDRDNRRFVAWYHKGDDPSDDRAQLYMLLERRSPDEFVLFLPQCDGAAGDIARRAGATVEQGTTKTCLFQTRASLEAAMRRVEISGDAIRIIRVPGT
jgi:hypothetical protein